MFSLCFSNSDAHEHKQYLGSVSVPAQMLREAVKADVVGLTLRPCWAEGQTVIVFLHLLHLQHNTHRGDIRVWNTDISRPTSEYKF